MTSGLSRWKIAYKFLLTRPSQGVTNTFTVSTPIQSISTHTPLAGRDFPDCLYQKYLIFLLTRPSQGVTGKRRPYRHRGRFLLTRPSQGVTNTFTVSTPIQSISTHTPLAGRDFPDCLYQKYLIFLLTRPSQGVTGKRRPYRHRGRFLLTRPSQGVTNGWPSPTAP